MRLPAGVRLGHYEIRRLVGAGGMGEVYQARDTTLDRDVAIKVLPENVTRDVTRLTRFEREAKLLAALNHPGIAGVHSLERVGDLQLLVMEFVSGITLAEMLTAGAMLARDAIRIARDIAIALEAAHAKGIIHRDLKPANVKVSSDGRVNVPASSLVGRLAWVSRQGAEQPLGDAPRAYANPRLGPGGRRVVVEVGNGDLWLRDLTRESFTLLTLGQTSNNQFPVWAPDGTRIVFRTARQLHWIESDGSGSPHDIAGTSIDDYPSSVSPDGQTLALTRINSGTSGDVYVLSLRGDPQPRPMLMTAAYEGGAQFSPDGRWLAYVSRESGQMEVYLRPYPGPDRKWQVSVGGGLHPMWNKAGAEIFYRSGQRMMSVSVSTQPELILSQPKVLFEGRYTYGQNLTTANYDVDPTGQRFLMVKDEAGGGRVNLILNWFEELTRRSPTDSR